MDENTPQDIREIASQLEALGRHDRQSAGDAVVRTTMRTTHLLQEPPAQAGGPRRLWIWLAGPAVAAAVLAGAVLVLNPARPSVDQTSGVQTLAAALESDIDAWAELDSMWSDDSFETDLAAVSLQAAGFDATADDSGLLPDVDADL